jgi:hypothetical protein
MASRQVWQKSLGTSANAGQAPGAGKDATSPGKGLKQQQPAQQQQQQQPPREWGADIEFRPPRLQAAPDEAQLDELAHADALAARWAAALCLLVY